VKRDGGALASDLEGLTTAAFTLHVRVLKLKALVEPLSGVVELRPIDIRKAFGVNEDGDPVAIETKIFSDSLVDKLQLIGQARATSGANPESNAHALAPLLDEATDVVGCTLS